MSQRENRKTKTQANPMRPYLPAHTATQHPPPPSTGLVFSSLSGRHPDREGDQQGQYSRRRRQAAQVQHDPHAAQRRQVGAGPAADDLPHSCAELQERDVTVRVRHRLWNSGLRSWGTLDGAAGLPGSGGFSLKGSSRAHKSDSFSDIRGKHEEKNIIACERKPRACTDVGFCM